MPNRLGVRGKLFAVSLGLVVVVGAASAIYVQVSLRGWLVARLIERLDAQALLARETVERTPWGWAPEPARELVTRLAASTGGRVTLFDAEGAVLADSVPASGGAPAPHAQRPEVEQAFTTGRGVQRRPGLGGGSDELFVAVRFTKAERQGVVRVGASLSEADALLARARWILVAAGLMGLLVAVVMSALASHLMTRTLRALMDDMTRVSQGGSRLALASTDELGRLVGSVNNLADELERNVSSLARERDRLETILESMSDALIALDDQHRVTLVNGAALRLLGLKDSPLGTSLFEAVRVPMLAELVNRRRGEEDVVEFDVPGASKRRVLARATALRRSPGTVLVLHDVTERRRLEAVRRDFVANVSHELRTPVAVIRANTETLIDGAIHDPKHGPAFLSGILRNSERLATLVSDLLDLSRIEAGQAQLEVGPQPVEELARQAVVDVAKLAADKRIALTVAVPSELMVKADARALDQILVNLLGNAVKYTPEGGHVVVAARREGAFVRLEVADDGPGVEPHHRERIFERFYRADPGRSRELGGTGLGLSIVKHLAEAMEGEVGVAGNEPKGSVFWVLLPGA